MSKIPFDVDRDDLATVRQIFLKKLRNDGGWNNLGPAEFNDYVEFTGPHPAERGAPAKLEQLTVAVFWELVGQGILVPGHGYSNPNLPRFMRTLYGRRLLQSDEPTPHDPLGYLTHLNSKVPDADTTVMAYLKESLDTFRSGNIVASTVMLGVAAERVFLLLCQAMIESLTYEPEIDELKKYLLRQAVPMKQVQDLVHKKMVSICEQQEHRKRGFPENAPIVVVGLYDLIRRQRNDLGHPREDPPSLDREDAHLYLQLFLRYYETAEVVRKYLTENSV